MNRVYYVDGGRRKIELNFSKQADPEVVCDGCIVILFKNEKMVLSYHPKRKGWEFPGGKVELGESIEDCAIREAYEETGSIIETLTLLGYFIVTTQNIKITSAIFYGKAGMMHPLPNHSEMERVGLFEELPQEISFDDDIYRLTLSYIRDEKSVKF